MSAAVSLAADLNGRWEGTFNTPNGDIQLAFNFKVDGSALTGTVETPNGDTPISDGKVNGDQFSFTVKVGDNNITHTGSISGDTIKMKVQGPWGTSDVTLKRAAKAKATSLVRNPWARSAPAA
ncbi:MAG: glycoside hydrolase [Terriglobia bacterium]